MASRKEQKEQARAARIAQQQQAAAQAQRTRRIQIFGGAIAIVVIVIVVAIVSTSGGGTKPQSATAKAASKHVNSLLAGIPESGNTLGDPKAKVTITEFGDLECSVCDEFATPTSFTNPENEPRVPVGRTSSSASTCGPARPSWFSGRLRPPLGEPDTNAFAQQQVAAEAAGLQGKEWYYVEDFMYNEQGPEGTNYVTEGYLEGLAKQIPGLNFKKWMSDRKRASLKNQVSADNQLGTTVDGGARNDSTPTVVISGPRGAASPILGLHQSGYGGYVSAINSVS